MTCISSSSTRILFFKPQDMGDLAISWRYLRMNIEFIHTEFTVFPGVFLVNVSSKMSIRCRLVIVGDGWWCELVFTVVFPTCQVRVSRFYQSCFDPPSSFLPLSSFLFPPSFSFSFSFSSTSLGSQLRAPDLSGHCWTSTAS